MRGTIAQLALAGLTVNGNLVTAPELSILFKLGNGTFATAVDKIKVEGQRGKPATVWELQASGLVQFATLAPATPAAPQVDEVTAATVDDVALV